MSGAAYPPVMSYFCEAAPNPCFEGEVHSGTHTLHTQCCHDPSVLDLGHALSS